ncbi:hypothetical protein [Amycolatopsis sp. SID8362]|nr:hypothetical protein [Amycolatopsis sp. SID8362]
MLAFHGGPIVGVASDGSALAAPMQLLRRHAAVISAAVLPTE